MMIWVLTLSYSEPTLIAAARSSQPTTTRSGLQEVVDRRALAEELGVADTTFTSVRRSTRSTTLALPTGTVDLLTTMHS